MQRRGSPGVEVGLTDKATVWPVLGQKQELRVLGAPVLQEHRAVVPCKVPVATDEMSRMKAGLSPMTF